MILESERRGFRLATASRRRYPLRCPIIIALTCIFSCNSEEGRETDNASQITSATQTTTTVGDTATDSEPSETSETGSEATAGETQETTVGSTDDPSTTESDSDTTESDTSPFTTSDSDSDSDSSGPTSDSDTTGPDPCNEILAATIRDMQQAHPDFETFTGDNAFTGIVESDLGDDGKPVYAHSGGTAQTTGPGEFFQWYHDVPGVNQAIEIQIPLTETMPGVYSFNDPAFFPIDNQGWGNEGNSHNFHFTTEIHLSFTYKPGQVFTFIGDDDLWTFINGKLAIDLGGLHPALTGSVDLDAQADVLGLTPGMTYSMDIFHAERHRDQSNFRIETTIDCFIPE